MAYYEVIFQHLFRTKECKIREAFLNRQTAARYLSLASIIPGRCPVPVPGINYTGPLPGTSPWNQLYRAAARYQSLASIIAGRCPVPVPGINYTGPRPGTSPWHQLYRAAARYQSLASIIPGRERFTWN